MDPRSSPKTIEGRCAGATKIGGWGGWTLLWNVVGRKKPSKTNILKGVTSGVNLFAGGKVLYLRELR